MRNSEWPTDIASARGIQETLRSRVVRENLAGPVNTVAGVDVGFEDGGKTLVLDVTTDFAAWDQITVSGLSFTNFTAASAADNLELEVYNDGSTVATDDKTKAVGAPTISSAADQVFEVGDPATAIAVITVADATGGAPMITAANDIRIRIPDDFYMLWDETVTRSEERRVGKENRSRWAPYE